MASTPSQLRRELRRARGGSGNGSNGGPPRLRRPQPATAEPPSAPQPRRRPRLKKLRIALVLLGLGVLAFVSWIFGIMMAVAQDLPQLENRAQFENAENSVVYDIEGEKLATLTGNERRILVDSDEISPTVKQAVVAIEDERFYEHRGVDFLGIGRAVYQDLLAGGTVQGGSTITQQFVKNALEAQDSRTVFQKLREAALAYHLERQWSKDKIMSEYLNSVYFGEGAYGIEAAARTFFGWNHEGCGNEADRCAAALLPHEAAMLAGLISSPDAYNPRSNPEAAVERRNLVLEKMLDQGAISEEQYELAIDEPPPKPSDIEPPKEDSAAPYFTSWLRQQVVDHYGAGEAFGGGLRIISTLDLDLQRAVEEIVSSKLAAIEPTASVVVLDNDTAAVRAMVGGSDFERTPFNLATNGHRQPGSAFKPFTLVTALEEGHTTTETFVSEQKEFTFHVSGVKEPQMFEVHNYEDTYRGTIDLLSATTYSDNSVYAELGLEVGTEDIAKTAEAMGIRTDLSTNPAMILGGLKTGVTPLEMTHAYVTLAHGGERVSGTLASSPGGPVGISQVKDSFGEDADVVETNDGDPGSNEIITERVISEETAGTAVGALETVVDSGTGAAANYGGFAWGKTGTTDDNADAWFCGATREITACVWVGHPEGSKPMETEYNGGPVDGGTYPALIWRDVVLAYEQLQDEEDPESSEPDTETVPAAPTAPVVPTTTTPVAPVPTTPTETAPVEPEPVPEEPVEPEPEAAPAPASPAPEGGTAPAEGGTAVGATG